MDAHSSHAEPGKTYRPPPLMERDPVILLADGETYERHVIEAKLATEAGTSRTPRGSPAPHRGLLVPNVALRSLLDEGLPVASLLHGTAWTGSSRAPSALVCPISLEVMSDPVVTVADGFCYEREAIEKWLQLHRTAPLTGVPLNTALLLPNKALRKVISAWREAAGGGPQAPGLTGECEEEQALSASMTAPVGGDREALLKLLVPVNVLESESGLVEAVGGEGEERREVEDACEALVLLLEERWQDAEVVLAALRCMLGLATEGCGARCGLDEESSDEEEGGGGMNGEGEEEEEGGPPGPQGQDRACVEVQEAGEEKEGGDGATVYDREEEGCKGCSNSQRLVEMGAVEAVLEALGLWAPHHQGVCVAGLTLLVRLCQNGGWHAFAERGGVGVVVAAMREMLGDLKAVRAGLKMLATIAGEIDGDAIWEGEVRAVADVVWEARALHGEAVRAQVLVCVVNLTCSSPLMREALGAKGACDWVVLELRSGQPTELCVLAIYALVLDPEANRRWLREAGAVELLMSQVGLVCIKCQAYPFTGAFLLHLPLLVAFVVFTLLLVGHHVTNSWRTPRQPPTGAAAPPTCLPPSLRSSASSHRTTPSREPLQSGCTPVRRGAHAMKKWPTCVEAQVSLGRVCASPVSVCALWSLIVGPAHRMLSVKCWHGTPRSPMCVCGHSTCVCALFRRGA